MDRETWLANLRALVEAARAVRDTPWPDDVREYPPSLPSFDEFVLELEEWHDAEARE